MRKRLQTGLVSLAVCLPVPVFALSGLALPLPPAFERVAAALVSGSKKVVHDLGVPREVLTIGRVTFTAEEAAAAEHAGRADDTASVESPAPISANLGNAVGEPNTSPTDDPKTGGGEDLGDNEKKKKKKKQEKKNGPESKDAGDAEPGQSPTGTGGGTRDTGPDQGSSGGGGTSGQPANDNASTSPTAGNSGGTEAPGAEGEGEGGEGGEGEGGEGGKSEGGKGEGGKGKGGGENPSQGGGENPSQGGGENPSQGGGGGKSGK